MSWDEAIEQIFNPLIERTKEILRERLAAYSPSENEKEKHMSIEKNIERIADALETIASAITTGKVAAPAAASAAAAAPGAEAEGKTGRKKAAPAAASAAAAAPSAAAAAAPAPAAAAPGETAPTKDDLIDELKVLVGDKGPEVAKKILSDFGAAKISDLKEEQYSAFYKQLKAAQLA